jgi:hypothetical protein
MARTRSGYAQTPKGLSARSAGNFLKHYEQSLQINADPAEVRFPRVFTEREIATILHGLRMIQCEGRIEGCAAGMCEHFEDYDELSNEEIDSLCEKINFPGESSL